MVKFFMAGITLGFLILSDFAHAAEKFDPSKLVTPDSLKDPAKTGVVLTEGSLIRQSAENLKALHAGTPSTESALPGANTIQQARSRTGGSTYAAAAAVKVNTTRPTVKRAPPTVRPTTTEVPATIPMARPVADQPKFPADVEAELAKLPPEFQTSARSSLAESAKFLASTNSDGIRDVAASVQARIDAGLAKATDYDPLEVAKAMGELAGKKQQFEAQLAKLPEADRTAIGDFETFVDQVFKRVDSVAGLKNATDVINGVHGNDGLPGYAVITKQYNESFQAKLTALIAAVGKPVTGEELAVLELQAHRFASEQEDFFYKLALGDDKASIDEMKRVCAIRRAA